MSATRSFARLIGAGCLVATALAAAAEPASPGPPAPPHAAPFARPAYPAGYRPVFRPLPPRAQPTRFAPMPGYRAPAWYAPRRPVGATGAPHRPTTAAPGRAPAGIRTDANTRAPSAAAAPAGSADKAPATGNKPEPASSQPPDGAGFSGDRAEFIERLTPIIRAENQRLLTLRARVESLAATIRTGARSSVAERDELRRLARHYRVEGAPHEQPAALAELLSKIDAIPVSLALAQAASESAWGRSRFAREGLNLFGIWTYDPAKGMVPKRRVEGRKHLVRKFDSIRESVRYYMHTLNSHPAYTELRRIRGEQRESADRFDGYEQAAGLESYSEKGEEYIRLIRAVITGYRLSRLDQPVRDG